MRSQFLILLLLEVTCSHANADPTRIPRWLMNEPISMFDWGILQTEQRLSSLNMYSNFTNRFISGSVSYDWDADRLRLEVSFWGSGTESECIENLKIAKANFVGYSTKFSNNNRTLTSAAPLTFAGLFGHPGFKNGAQPKDLGEQLANISTLEATIWVLQGKDDSLPKVRCQTTFKSQEILVVHPASK